MQAPWTAAAILSATLLPLAAQAQLFQYENKILLGAGEGEIVSYHSATQTIAVTGGLNTVKLFTLNADATTTAGPIVTFADPFVGTTLGNISSTALDPAGRGFGVVSMIPANNGGTVGKVGFYDYTTGAVLHTLDVGFHPDSVKFSADGSKLLVANEGEYTLGGDADAPGSLSVIDLSSVFGVGDVGGLGAAHVGTFDFSPGNLSGGATLAGVRVNDLSATEAFRHIEPEYIAVDGDRVIVSLQENNALGVFDTGTSQWTSLFNLGTIANTIDASDRDSATGDEAALIDDVVKGLPMPDAIATYSVGGQTYVVTANEGDFRVDEATEKRIKNFAGAAPGSGIDFETISQDSALGRLTVETVDVDPDGDNLIDDIIVPGTRSFSIWNADTGELVADSGSLENFLLAQDPTRHNANDGGDPDSFDSRSDAKGPEPEGLDVLVLPNGTVLLAIGMERQNGLVLADITNPESPVLIDYINSNGEGLISPESLLFVSAEDSPTGLPLLLVGYEGVPEDGIAGGIGIYTVPEPGTLAILAAASLLLRRRR